MVNTRILIADDEETICKLLQSEFALKGFRVDTAHNGAEALAALRAHTYAAAVLDINMPVCSGLQVLSDTKRTGECPLVILMTAYGSIDGAVLAMKMQADDYITKPFAPTDLVEKVQQMLRVRSAVTALPKPSGIAIPQPLGQSMAMEEIRRKVAKVRDLNTTVLITGESGTGKGVVAKHIHMASVRSAQPFAHIDCASLPHNLIESELFGHEKGAFTHAVAQKKGKLELAGTGTVFLDEIGTLSPELQAKLLIVLQERSFERLGGCRPIPLEARIIAATNENLEQAVATGDFRADLFYRLNIVCIECPPLRNRREDIPELARYFVREHAAKTGISIESVDDDVWDALLEYDWPGNVRELENTLESAVVLSDGHCLHLGDLPKKIIAQVASGGAGVQGASSLSLENQEILTILAALEKHGGHREKTARELGISRRALQYKLNKYHLFK